MKTDENCCQNYYVGVGLIILYLIILTVRNFTEPKIVGDQLGLNPVVTLIAIYLGYLWMGVGGMIFLPILTWDGRSSWPCPAPAGESTPFPGTQGGSED